MYAVLLHVKEQLSTELPVARLESEAAMQCELPSLFLYLVLSWLPQTDLTIPLTGASAPISLMGAHGRAWCLWAQSKVSPHIRFLAGDLG